MIAIVWKKLQAQTNDSNCLEKVFVNNFNGSKKVASVNKWLQFVIMIENRFYTAWFKIETKLTRWKCVSRVRSTWEKGCKWLQAYENYRNNVVALFHRTVCISTNTLIFYCVDGRIWIFRMPLSEPLQDAIYFSVTFQASRKGHVFKATVTRNWDGLKVFSLWV